MLSRNTKNLIIAKNRDNCQILKTQAVKLVSILFCSKAAVNIFFEFIKSYTDESISLFIFVLSY